MKVILRNDLDGLGKRGDIVDVADGYGRNYLLPRGLALKATRRRRRPGGEDAPGPRPARRQPTARRPRPSPPRWCRRSSRSRPRPAPKASSSARSPSADVVDAVREQTGIALERRQVETEPIKSLGQHTVTAKLHTAVSFPITLEVVSA